MIIARKVTIIREIRAMRKGSVNEEIKWLGNSLGLFTLRDKDSSCYRIFVELLKNTKVNHALSSDDIALNLSLSRGTVIHHLNRLMNSGLVEYEKGKYKLRVSNLEALINEIERDIQRTFQDIKEIAKRIDSELEI